VFFNPVAFHPVNKKETPHDDQSETVDSFDAAVVMAHLATGSCSHFLTAAGHAVEKTRPGAEVMGEAN
jgi:hypothetical protein